MSTEELLWRSYSTLFAFSVFHRQVNPAGHSVVVLGTMCAARGVFGHTTKGFILKAILV